MNNHLLNCFWNVNCGLRPAEALGRQGLSFFVSNAQHQSRPNTECYRSITSQFWAFTIVSAVGTRSSGAASSRNVDLSLPLDRAYIPRDGYRANSVANQVVAKPALCYN